MAKPRATQRLPNRHRRHLAVPSSTFAFRPNQIPRGGDQEQDFEETAEAAATAVETDAEPHESSASTTSTNNKPKASSVAASATLVSKLSTVFASIDQSGRLIIAHR